jgi:hypothetical protein
MVDTLARSDQDIDSSVANLSKRARFWLLTVAALDVCCWSFPRWSR